MSDLPVAADLHEAIAPVVGPQVAAEVVAVIKNDPALQNSMGLEPWWQSGVGFFGASGAGYSLLWLAQQTLVHGVDFQGYDATAMWDHILTFGGFAGVLFRRYVPGLKPLFHSFTKGR